MPASTVSDLNTGNRIGWAVVPPVARHSTGSEACPAAARSSLNSDLVWIGTRAASSSQLSNLAGRSSRACMARAHGDRARLSAHPAFNLCSWKPATSAGGWA